MAGILDEATARRFAALTLGHVEREFPYGLQHVVTGSGDLALPRAQHPVFFGSFDWHSCVHGWWQLHRLARRFPAMPEAAAIAARTAARFTPEAVAGEIAYFERPSARGFERPYGWAWLLMLDRELAAGGNSVLAPFARLIAARFADHLPKLTYPIRAGTHANSAFALLLARRWAEAFDPPLLALIDDRARGWFGGDRDCQAWEPGGDEFLSPALTEATLMAAVPGDGFAAWFDAFLPEAAAGRPATLFAPAHVSDRSDGKIAHLDGLNLSRAWCWRAVAAALGPGHRATPGASAAAAAHLAAALPHLAADYMGEHWLASFALLALDGL